ncbi:MAG TPA: glycosyltransferase, partial [Candidatus Ozemobacteraceae bacterium]|nr:glycosyltransferase [Candidatus Ozemobacteraceae bacterium]
MPVPLFYTAPVNTTGGLLWSCNFAVKRSVFILVGGFDENFRFAHLEDVDLRIRLQQHGYRMAFVPQAVVHHPPRPFDDDFSIPWLYESEFYFRSKHRISIAKAGLNLRNIFGFHARLIKNSRSCSDLFRILRRFLFKYG